MVQQDGSKCTLFVSFDMSLASLASFGTKKDDSRKFQNFANLHSFIHTVYTILYCNLRINKVPPPKNICGIFFLKKSIFGKHVFWPLSFNFEI